MKRIISRILKKYGYKIIRDDKFQLLMKKKNVSKKTRTNPLTNFVLLLDSLGYTPKVVFDIGAHLGNWTKELIKYYPDAYYYLFEPQKDLCYIIENEFSLNKKIKLFNVGVGNQNDELDFTLHERKDSSSFRFSNKEANENGYEQTKIPIVSLESFIEKKDLPFPNILKIDAEGFDLEVLKGAISFLPKVDIIFIEVGIVNKSIENSAFEVMSFLNTHDFRLFDITALNRPFSHKILWLSEFVFIRNGSFLDKEYNK
jgi:FkbM family methyltransferase